MLLVSEVDENVSAEAVGEAVLALPEDMRQHVLTLLAQAADDAAWAEQIGPAYTRKQVAELLGVSTTAVAKNPRLLQLKQRSGARVYPVVQFDGDTVSEDVGAVVRLLSEVVETPWTTASWLTSARSELVGLRPVDVLLGRRVSAHEVADAADHVGENHLAHEFPERSTVLEMALDAAYDLGPDGWAPDPALIDEFFAKMA